MNNFKRQMRKSFNTTNAQPKHKNIASIVFGIALIIFLGSQLFINAQLSPLGMKLQSLNDEKNALIAQNRQIQQELATIQSLSSIQHLSKNDKKLKTVTSTQLVYVFDIGLRAEK
jgi:hypothetical protein